MVSTDDVCVKVLITSSFHQGKIVDQDSVSSIDDSLCRRECDEEGPLLDMLISDASKNSQHW
jgi:hypothetical protein